MYVLGITHKFSYNQAACLLKDGQIVAFAEEERFTRIKQAFQMFPINAIRFCLDKAGIEPRQVEKITICWEKTEDIWRTLNTSEFAKYAYQDWDQIIFETGPDKDIYEEADLIKDLAIANFNIGNLSWLDHHRCHIASTVAASGFEECNYITYDGDGGASAGRVGFYTNNEMHDHEWFHCVGSLGVFYERITEFLGFTPHKEEGKTMGLASYGEYDESLIPRSAFFRNQGGLLQIDQNAVKDRLRELYEEGYQDKVKENILSKEAVNLAHTAQKYLEEMLIDAAKFMYRRTGCRNFALAGGSLLNCSANGALLNQDFVDNIFVQPAAGDSGCALGGAIMEYAALNKTNKLTNINFPNAYYGSSFPKKEVLEILKAYGLKFLELEDPALKLAELIHQDNVIGYFEGAAEVGPRALCHRSILANPTIKANLDRVNKIKNRESWRPLAPVMTEEDFHDIVDLKNYSPYMLIAAQVKEDWKEKIPAVTHVDGSCRPQSVNVEQNETIHKALNHFKSLSGSPVFMNTSFNLRGEPLVDSPEDAVKTFINSDLNYLMIEGILACK